MNKQQEFRRKLETFKVRRASINLRLLIGLHVFAALCGAIMALPDIAVVIMAIKELIK